MKNIAAALLILALPQVAKAQALAPGSLRQIQLDETTEIAPGGSPWGSSLILSAVARFASGEEGVLCIDLMPASQEYMDAAPDFISAPVHDGDVVTLTVSKMQGSSWKWRAFGRVGGVDSPETWFGGTFAETAFRMAAGWNPDPAPPAELAQRETGTNAPILVGAEVIEDSLVFNAGLHCMINDGSYDADYPDHQVRLELEIRPLGVPFTNYPTHQGPWKTDGHDVPVATSFAIDGVYGPCHWQARTTCDSGAISRWTKFGVNPEDQADFIMPAADPEDPFYTEPLSRSNKKTCAAAGTSSRWPALLLLAILLRATRKASLPAAMLVLPAVAAAQAGPETWSDPAGAPFNVTVGAAAAGTGTGPIYVYSGKQSGPVTFAKGQPGPSGMSWTNLPGFESTGVSTYFATSAAIDSATGRVYLIVPQGTTTAPLVEFDPATSTWTRKADVSDANPITRAGLAWAGGKLYMLTYYNSSTGRLWSYAPAPGLYGGAWTWLSNLSSIVLDGAGLAASDAGDVLFATPAREAFWKYSIAGNTWTRLADVLTKPTPQTLITTYGVVTGPGGSVICIGESTALPAPLLRRYDGTAWSTLDAMPGTVGTGTRLARSGADSVTAIRGTGRNDTWTYSFTAARFVTTLPLAPATLGVSAAVGDAGCVYAFAGGKDFHRFRASDGQWTKLADAPADVTYLPLSLVSAGGGILYAMAGGATWKYDAAADAWTPFQNGLPAGHTMKDGHAIALGDDNCLYATTYSAPGSPAVPQGNMIRYALSGGLTGTWQALDAAPAVIGRGGALVRGPYNTLYCVRGAGTTDFWRYSTVQQKWNVLDDGVSSVPPPAPQAFTSGASALYPRTGPLLFAFSGRSTSDSGSMGAFWSYSAKTNAWSALPLATPPVTGELVLAYAGEGSRLHAVQGTGSRLIWAYEMASVGQAPPAPSGLEQFLRDGTTRVGLHDRIEDTAFVAQALQAEDPDGDVFRLEIEVAEWGGDFRGIATAVSPFLLGDDLAATVTGLKPQQAYHWRARNVEVYGPATRWVSFGTDPEDPAEVDFETDVNLEPSLTSLKQRFGPDSYQLRVGGRFTEGASLTLEVIAADANPTDFASVEFEVRPVDEEFLGVATGTLTLEATGGARRVVITPPAGSFHWRARPLDSRGLAGPWTSFGGNDDGAADFTVLARPVEISGSTGPSSCLHSGSGSSMPLVFLIGMIAFLIRR